MTSVLSYSPSVEAYVAVLGKDAAVDYYNISPDIVHCSVSRKTDGSSSFSMRLQNRNGKYNNLFTPMDRITIYAAKKGEKHQLLTGYITSVSRFTLYPADFEMSGYCSLYKLQKLYWDPGLAASYELMTGNGLSIGTDWEGYSGLIRRLVCTVGGMPNGIKIGPVPDEVIEWARELYAAKMTDIDDMRSKISAFYDMLASTNRMTASAGGGVASSRAIEAAVQWALKIAADDSIGYSWVHGRGEGILEGKQTDVDCSSLVFWSLVASGGWTRDQLGGTPFATYTMAPILQRNGFAMVSWNRNPAELKRGDILWRNSGTNGHTELYIGDGKMVGAVGSETGSPYVSLYGDQTGNEVRVTNVWTDFTHYFRFSGGKEQ